MSADTAPQTSAARRPLETPVSPVATASVGKLALPVKLFLLSLIFPVVFNLGPLHMTGMRLVLLLTIVPLTFMLLAGRFGRLHLADYAYLAHAFWIMLSLAFNNPAQVIQFGGSAVAEFLGGYMIARAYIRDRATFIALCKLLALIAMAFLPLALFETLTGRAIILELIRSVPGISSETPISMEQRMGLERVQGVFAHPIHFGLFCSTAFSLAFIGLNGIYGAKQRILFSALIALTGFFSLSSGAILAIGLQFALIIWFVMFRKVEARWWILLGLIVFAYIAIDILSTRSPVRVFMSYATFSSHNAFWRGIIFDWGVMNIFGSEGNNIPPAPFFGIGLADWVRPSFMVSSSMDNFWLLTAVRYGMPALMLLLTGYVGTMFAVGRRDFGTDEQLNSLRRAWMFIFAGLTFTLVTVHVWTSIYSYVFFLFGAGIWFLNVTPDDGSDTAEVDQPATENRTSYSRFPVARGSRHARAGS